MRNRNYSFWRAAGNSLLFLLYPELCTGCSRTLLPEENVLCLACQLQLQETNYHHIPDNETVLRLAGRFAFVHATSYAYFVKDGILQKVLHQLKYEGRKKNGTYLGHRFGQSILDMPWLSDISCILPVPLFKAKERQRGYNQTAVIASAMSSVLGITVADNLIERIRNTDTQVHKNRTERMENLQSAFRITDEERLRNRHVLLLDDVLTTGATLEACSLCLQEVPGIRISLATIGLAVS